VRENFNQEEMNLFFKILKKINKISKNHK
jgi:hypothetical protein